MKKIGKYAFIMVASATIVFSACLTPNGDKNSVDQEYADNEGVTDSTKLTNFGDSVELGMPTPAQSQDSMQ